MSALPAVFGMPGAGSGEGQSGPPTQRTDSDFEQSLFDLSYPIIRDKAPTLLPNMVGFQTLDKDEDGNRVVGVFAFQIGKQNIFAPIFFLNGELKGNELMYLQNDDLFVPLDESWIGYVMGRKPYMMGESTDESTSSLSRSEPDLRVFYDTPMRGAKMASSVIDAMKKAALSKPKPILDWIQGELDVKHSLTALDKVAEWCATLPDTFLKYDSALPQKLLTLRQELRKKAAFDFPGLNTPPDVVIIDSLDDPRTEFFTFEEREEMATEGAVFRDNRPQTSNVYSMKLPKNFTNPTTTGVYDVLTRGGEMKRMLVVVNPKTIGRGGTRLATLYDADSNGYAHVLRGEVWVGKHHARDWGQEFTKMSPVSSLNRGDVAIIMNELRDATLPFRVLNRLDRADGRTELEVEVFTDVQDSRSFSTRRTHPWDVRHEKSYITVSRQSGVEQTAEYLSCCGVPYSSDGMPPDPTKSHDIGDSYISGYRGKIIVQEEGVASPQTISAVGTATIVGPECRFVKITKRLSPENDAGTLLDLETSFYKCGAAELGLKNSGASTLKLNVSTDDFRITTTLGTTQPLTAKEAMEHLTYRWGIHCKVAHKLVKQAMRDQQLRVWVVFAPGYPRDVIKKADVGDDVMGLPVLPAQQFGFDSTSGAIMTQPENHRVPIPVYQRAVDPRLAGDPMESMRSIQSAGETGNQSVLDASMLVHLLNSMNVDELINKYVGDCLRALDRIGRLLFMLYWHFDKFKERYGSGDLPDLEAALKNVFNGLGELVLNMRQKTIESLPDMRMLDLTASN